MRRNEKLFIFLFSILLIFMTFNIQSMYAAPNETAVADEESIESEVKTEKILTLPSMISVKWKEVEVPIEVSSDLNVENGEQALESVLAESDYAGNLSYNPDKRLNASDILNAVKNAVKPELAPALSVVKNVDANEEPSYAIQNIDEKELPEKLEIDTNTDKKVVLKKDGNTYKFDK